MNLRYLLFFATAALLCSSVGAETHKTENIWKPNDKYNVVSPILAELHQLREQMAGPDVNVRQIQSAMSKLYSDAAANANAETRALDSDRHVVTPQTIQRWAAIATNLGRSGLVKGPTSSIARFAKEYNGHWQLQSRLGKGVESVTDGHMFFDIDPATGRGNTLIIEGGTVDQRIVESEESVGDLQLDSPLPFSIGAYFRTTLIDNDGEISVESQGEIVGSYNPVFQEGLETTVTSIYQGYGEGSTLIAEAHSPSNSGIYDEWSRIEVSGDTLVMVSPNLDVIDTYTRVAGRSDDSGAMRVNGVWTLDEYWDFLRQTNALTNPPKR